MADSKLGYGGTPFSKLAKLVPKPKKSGNEALDDKRNADFKYMVQIIDRMEKDNSIIQPLHGLMMSHDLEAIAAASDTRPEWTGKYQQLRRLPPWFIISWLDAQAAKEGLFGVNSETFCALEESDHEKLIMLLTYVVQLPETQT